MLKKTWNQIICVSSVPKWELTWANLVIIIEPIQYFFSIKGRTVTTQFWFRFLASNGGLNAACPSLSYSMHRIHTQKNCWAHEIIKYRYILFFLTHLKITVACSLYSYLGCYIVFKIIKLYYKWYYYKLCLLLTQLCDVTRTFNTWGLLC